MNNTEQIFNSVVKNLHKAIHAGQTGVFVSQVLSFIEKNYDGKERQEKYAVILDELLYYDFVKNSEVCNENLLPVINVFAESSDLNAFDIWGIIFDKFIGAKLNCRHPIIYSDILRICKSRFIFVAKNPLCLTFPLNDINLSEILLIWEELFFKYISENTSYEIFLNGEIRNKLSKYILSQCEKKNETLRILFPYPGTGIDALLLLYLMSLISEIKDGVIRENIQFILIGEKDELLNAVSQNYNGYDEIFISLKKSFCEQNNIKIKDIQTNLKKIKRKITVKSAKEYEESPIYCDIVLLNKKQLTNQIIDKYSEYGEKTLYEFDNIPGNENISQNRENSEMIVGSFNITDECQVQYFICENEKKQKTNIPEEKKDMFDILYANKDKMEPSELKKKLTIEEYIVNENRMIKYGEMLLKSGQYSKSFQIIKQHYKRDFDKSYEIVSEILEKSKNNKLNQAIERFIVDTEMKENGFGEAMLESIVDGIEDYFDSNPDSILKDKQWL